MPYETTMTAQGQVQVLRERRAMKDGITHCPRCGHHVNIQFGETTGYCPICDEIIALTNYFKVVDDEIAD